ncbi:MAG: hypothetical protein M2R45_04935 [Verrucomicrobia subdivision 3 bacterium]|nr:hypothetical protein [Limisphaerales bacterium]MCS1415628.1 hypothetical protein [Limisphaerales bacterium]
MPRSLPGSGIQQNYDRWQLHAAMPPREKFALLIAMIVTVFVFRALVRLPSSHTKVGVS